MPRPTNHRGITRSASCAAPVPTQLGVMQWLDVRARTAAGSGASTGHGTWLDADVHPWPATTRGAADDRSPSASAGSLARSKALESFLLMKRERPSSTDLEAGRLTGLARYAAGIVRSWKNEAAWLP